MPGMTGTIDFAVAGPLTRIDTVYEPALAALPREAVEICRLVHDLVVQPTDAKGLSVPDERFAENQLRPVNGLIGALLALDAAPLTVARDPARRVIGTCRHFAVLSCALLRYRGIAARARCGFATYFQPGQGVDHWITEYRQDGRWVRIDSEILGGSLVAKPEDLATDEFLTGGEAWAAFRQGHIDAATFGVYGTENWGPAGPTRATPAPNTTNSSTRSPQSAPPTIPTPSRTSTTPRTSPCLPHYCSNARGGFPLTTPPRR